MKWMVNLYLLRNNKYYEKPKMKIIIIAFSSQFSALNKKINKPFMVLSIQLTIKTDAYLTQTKGGFQIH